MSWFTLRDQPDRRRLRGVWLRCGSNPDVQGAIRRSGLKRLTETVEWVEVKEVRPGRRVLLEVWCISLLDCVRRRRRHNVFHMDMLENPDWVCEGDLGRGLETAQKEEHA
jgi:hypothetical protein